MLTLANTSKQHHKFFYRHPGRMQHTFIDIASGRQVELKDIFDANAIENVIAQLRVIGARSKEDLSIKPDPDFHGLVFSVNKPLTTEQILESAEKVSDGADITSADESIKSAIGADSVIYDENKKSRRNRESTIQVIATAPNGQPLDGGIDMDLTVSPSGDSIHSMKR